jgi:hypothetical protein
MIPGATLMRDFKLDSRRIAEQMWGRDATEYKTNRKGARYFSCSQHGGYVVDSRCLTDEEKDRIQPYMNEYNPAPVSVLVQHQGERDVIIGTSYAHFTNTGRARNIRYNPALGPVEWVLVPVYTFEEDVDYAILEKLTDIRAHGAMMPTPDGPVPATREYRDRQVDQVFQIYHAHKVKA